MEAKTSVERCKEVERGSVYYSGDEGVFLGLKVTSSLQGGDKEVKEASKVVTRSDDWAKCPVTGRSMDSTTCEIMWIVKILGEFGINNVVPAELFCDTKSAIQIAANPILHEKTKHFDIDVHLVR
ncbi:ribonuclease H-like domain-containing protein [Tanacetum coccineum]